MQVKQINNALIEVVTLQRKNDIALNFHFNMKRNMIAWRAVMHNNLLSEK